MFQKRLLSALGLVGIALVAWFGFKLGSNDSVPAPSAQVLATQDSHSIPAPEVQIQQAIHSKEVSRVVRRKSVQVKDSAIAMTVDIEAQVDTKTLVEIPLPRVWKGEFVQVIRTSPQQTCDFDRPCSPMGRDGVLLVGAAVALDGLYPQFDRILKVGSYQDRTPLLVYK